MEAKTTEYTEIENWISSHGSQIKYLAIDTRKLIVPSQTVFFAIEGHKDGHDFISDAYNRGVRYFVISNNQNVKLHSDAYYLHVSSTLNALQSFARIRRELFNLKVIGITGSNGKTIVKEWLNQLLSAEWSIVRSPKSYNSQLGVPLSVWEIQEYHNLGIFEAGISMAGEMEALESIIQPEIGVLTNLTGVHDQGFVSRQEKLKEKLQLFTHCEWLVYSPDYLYGMAAADLPGKKKFSWSMHQEADLQIIGSQTIQNHRILTAKYKESVLTCSVPVGDAASVENAVICWATMLCMGYTANSAAERLADLVPVPTRLELKSGINSCTLIDDSYSADLASLAIALDFLQQQAGENKKTVLLSDLQQTGRDRAALYHEVENLLHEKCIDRLIGIGNDIQIMSDFTTLDACFYQSTELFIANFDESGFSNECILVKGARIYGFEQITKLLSQKVHETVLEVDMAAIVANLNVYRAKLIPGVKMMVMVKAFAYGSGLFEIANLLQYHQVDYLAVAYADEGIALRKAGISMPIMVMSPEPSAFDAIIHYRLEPEIYSLDILQSFISWLTPDKTHPVHIKLDTGMHRLGISEHEIHQIAELLAENSHIKVISVFSHLAASGEPSFNQFTALQIERFNQAVDVLTAKLKYQPIKHILNSSGISTLPQAQMDMVRLGIGLYGYDSTLPKQQLTNVTTLKTTITQVKHLKAGETVGYSRAGILPNGGTIATVKIGYADGYSRAFGNGTGRMRVRGKEVPTIGTICMDMCMLDVTGLNAQAGDEVVVFDGKMDVSTLALQIGTIPYEILTNISQRVKRVYFYE